MLAYVQKEIITISPFKEKWSQQGRDDEDRRKWKKIFELQHFETAVEMNEFLIIRVF